MRSHRLSMSRMSLAMKCLYGFRGDVEVLPRAVGEPARLGSAVHFIAETKVTGRKADFTTIGFSERDVGVIREAWAIADGPLSQLLDSRKWTACEIGMRYCASNDLTMAGPRRGEPGYEDVGPMVLPGTLDLVHVDGDEALVLDIKSGKAPEDSEQLYAQAVAVSRYYPGVTRVRVGYAMARKTKCEIAADEVLDVDELDAHAGKIAKLLRRLPMVDKGTTGKYCWRCDARPMCPAWISDGAQSGSEMPPDEYFGGGEAA